MYRYKSAMGCWLTVVVCVLSVAALPGCPVTPTPPAAAVLEGDWVAIEVEGADVFLRFDEAGIVVRVFAITDDATTINVDITDASTTLDGSDVTLTIPINDFVVMFEGTLSDDENTLTGSSSREFPIGDDITITVPAGEITFVRTECLVDEDCTGEEVCVGYVCGEEAPPGPADTFPTSLHFLRSGKATFYEAEDGFMSLTNIPIAELACNKCHGALADGSTVSNDEYTPSCRDCHADPDDPGANPVTDAICLTCHGRQGAEQNLFSDVHRTAGMGCVDCHSQREMHGDGTVYSSLLAEGASDTACQNCHVDGGSATPPGDNTFHLLHGEALDCSACHVKSVSSCYNCHFETEIELEAKRFFAQAPRTGFKMLVNYEGKVQTATFQALSYDGQTFLAMAPFFGHSITKEDIACGDCHRQNGAGNANVQEYMDTGQIVVTSWDATAEGAARLVGPNGVIPVPEDWQTSLIFAFLDYTGDPTDAINGANNLPLWDFLKNGADGSHMPFGTPLTDEQMDALMNN